MIYFWSYAISPIAKRLIFSKIPFLKYEFEESCNIKPLEEIVKNDIKVLPDFATYHEILTQFISEEKNDPEEVNKSLKNGQ